MNFLEDLERDRTELRISHILQFYSIPKIEKITGKTGAEAQKFVYRDIHLSGVPLSDGKKGNKVIKLIGDEHKSPDERKKLEDELSVIEVKGEMVGTPTEALAVSVETFNDFNNSVQVVKYSSFEKNQAIDQAKRMEFANWRVGMGRLVPIKNPQGLIEYVEEAFDIDTDQFETASANPQNQPTPGQPAQAPGGAQPNFLKSNSPTSAIGQAAQM